MAATARAGARERARVAVPHHGRRVTARVPPRARRGAPARALSGGGATSGATDEADAYPGGDELSTLDPDVVEATERAAVACVVAYGRDDEDGVPPAEAAAAASARARELLAVCATRAAAGCATAAALVGTPEGGAQSDSESPVRAPSVRAGLLPLARLAAWAPRDGWVRPPAEWDPAANVAAKAARADASDEEAAAAAAVSLAAHLLERWPAPPALRAALPYVGAEDEPEEGEGDGGSLTTAVACTEEANLVSRAFFLAYADVATGAAGARAALRARVHAGLSKRAVGALVALGTEAAGEEEGEDEDEGAGNGEATAGADGDGAQKADGGEGTWWTSARVPSNPLRALRLAQCAAAGGPDWAARAAAGSSLSKRLGDDAGEAFAADALGWAMTHAGELRELEATEPRATAVCLNFMADMHELSGKHADVRDLEVDDDEVLDAGPAAPYSPAGRTPKRVLAAADRYYAATVTFEGEDDELFERNPRGLTGFYRASARIPRGTEVQVPYVQGSETLGVEDAPGAEACQLKVEEIRSLKRLIHEGKMLGNCLENRYSSQVKYVMRIRQRSSSYWSMTAVRECGRVDFLGLLEVWHLEGGKNIVHQFEGPRPRTLPLAEGWYWMQQWCDQEGIDWTTWECYSNFWGY